ncbi:MAG: PQQ-like beta-propeller repeat protein [Spirochaetes bacterium]|nr:PQQ-like beta-propeller repeat protein [Spirochaetota bacterium]
MDDDTYLIGEASPHASGWTIWRGPLRNGSISTTGFDPEFTKKSGQTVWKASVGNGYSAIAATSDRVYTAGLKSSGGKQLTTIYALDASNGRVIWTHDFEAGKKYQYAGPRAMPVIYDNRLYMIGSDGDIHCLTLDNGRPVWKRDLRKKEKLSAGQYGIASSAVIEDDVIYLNIGGGIALDAETGKTRWKNSDAEPGYASPVLFSFKGKRSIMMFNSTALVMLDAVNGRQLAEYSWKTSHNVNAADPLLLAGNKVLISSGYGRGSTLLDYSTGSFKKIWESKDLGSHFSSLIEHKGLVYGIEGNTGQRSRNNFVCMDPRTGKVIWKEKTSQYGSLIKINDTIIFFGEDGILIPINPSRSGYSAGKTMEIFKGRGIAWSTPTFWNNRLYLRSNTGEVTCVRTD